MRMKDKVVILTGASSGIGNATALKLASEGAKVTVVARRAERLEELKEKAADLPGEIYPVPGDVSKDEDIAKAVDMTVEKYGRIDVLINNAGILDNYLSADSMTDEVWDKVMAVNVTGPMKMIRAAMPVMLKQGKGNIINTSSVGGLFGGKGGMAYVASKHALIGMTKHIGVMFQDKGIRCNAIAPGTIKTEIAGTVKTPNMDMMQKIVKGFQNFPVVADAEEIANIMLFLASDESSFVNGTTLVADGGWTAF